MLIGAFVVEPPSLGAAVAAGVAVATLVAQMLIVRPRLTRRSDAVLAGSDGPRSRAHWEYVGLEIGKVAGLLIAGVLLLVT